MSDDVIRPCPFSKGYGIPAQQAWGLLKVFFLYRLILASLFVIVGFSRFGPAIFDLDNPTLYSTLSLTYLVLAIISGTVIYLRLFDYAFHAQTQIFTDIIIITLLMHVCGGVTSGIGVFLVITTAANGLLVGGRCAMLFAALAALAVLAEQLYTAQTHIVEANAFTASGMLGGAFLAIALLSYILAGRAELTEQLADQRKLTILKLEELNRYIIQHLQSGIIIVNQKQYISMANEAALRLLNLPSAPATLAAISSQLSSLFQCWRKAPDQDTAKLRLADDTEIQIRLSVLPTRMEIYYMIILEDIGFYNQRLQQSKLASLGRLSASIAHEIRNPLGAISHAGQLLSECPDLTSQDQRLTEIIQTQSQRVNQIVENVLQLSRRHPSNREKIHLDVWLPDYLHKFNLENNLPQSRFKLKIDADMLCAYMDPNHLKQILDNLCLNALKYGNKDRKELLIQAFRMQKSPCVAVIDNGNGISPEHVSQLFEPFFTTSVTGTGLGLYISRELAELNQAKLSYSLTDDNKSSFRLTLPAAEQTLIAI